MKMNTPTKRVPLKGLLTLGALTLFAMNSVGFGQIAPDNFHHIIILVGGISFSDPEPAKDAVVSDAQPPIKIKIRTRLGATYQSIELKSVSFALPGCLPISFGDPGFYATLPKDIPGGKEYPVLVDLNGAGCTLAQGPVTVKVEAKADATQLGQPIKTISAKYEWSFTVELTPSPPPGPPAPPSDIDPPSFSGQQPAPNSTIAFNQPLIAVQIDDMSGINVQSIKLTVTGCPSTFVVGGMGVNFSGGFLTVDLSMTGCTLPAGFIQVNISADDMATPANTGSTSWSFTVQGASTLKSFDINNNNLIDDPEFFAIIDAWIAGQINDSIFFQAVDLWVSQSPISSAGLSANPLRPNAIAQAHTPYLANHKVMFRVSGPGIATMSVEIYDLNSRQIFSHETAGMRLVWNLNSLSGRPVANGVYLYTVTARDFDGRVLLRSAVKQLPIVR